ncbi:hypothetical protein D3C87_988810 [compost metagenome]
MSGFTEDEIAAEMKRRRDVADHRNGAYRENMRRAEQSDCDTPCLSCGTPVMTYMVSDSENPLCDTCLGD